MRRVALVRNAPADSGMGKPARLLREALQAQAGKDWKFDEWVLDARRGTVSCGGDLRGALLSPTPWKPLAWVRLARFLELSTYDLVHLTNQTLSFLTPHLRSPSVITVWDLIEWTNPQETGGGLVARYLYRGLPRATHLLAVSRATAGEIRRIFRVPEENISIVQPAPAPTFRYQPDCLATPEARAILTELTLPADAPVVLAVGSEHPRKNLPTLATALGLVRRALPSLRWVKIGAPGIRAGRRALVRAIEQADLARNVHFVPQADDAALLFWYHRASLLAFPSRAEGFGFPPLEAMACGTPVVAGNRSSLPEVIGDSGLLVDPDDPCALADALTRVLTLSDLRDRLRESGLTRVKAFSWTETARQTLSVYARLLSRGPSR